MSASIQAQVLALGGIPTPASAIQGSIKAQLIGVDLAAFSAGESTAEAVARRDPGASSASLVFTKTGQTLALPNELAKAIIGQTYGTASIAVEMLDRGNGNSISASLQKINAKAAAAAPSNTAESAQTLGARFTSAAQTLSLTAAPMPNPASWSSLVATLLPLSTPAQSLAFEALASSLFSVGKLENLITKTSKNAIAAGVFGTQTNASSQLNSQGIESTNADLPTAGQQAASKEIKPLAENGAETLPETIQHQLASVIPGSGIGFERAVATMSTRGPEQAREMAATIEKYPQAASSTEATSSQWIAQQAHAKNQNEAMWMGQAWAGTPAWLAVGSSESKSDQALETRVKTNTTGKASMAWMRLRVEPPGLGTIDVWAVLLGEGRCTMRVSAQPKAKIALSAARGAFSSILEAARVDLSVEFKEGEP